MSQNAIPKGEIALADGTQVPVYTVNTLVIGTGAAGLNCAEHLYDLGVDPIAIVTDRLGAGTSANSGSDKQTYYKIGVFGDVPDSPMDFAHSLFDGGMMHGDIAYCEGIGSATEFFHLIKNGVPFPFNKYGAYVGYKTDHDPRQRATSCGPKTSMRMVDKSLAQVRRNGTPVFDRHEVIELLTAQDGQDTRVVGAVALDTERLDAPDFGLVVFCANNVVLATGGPGEMYKASVYPPGQIGNHGLALRTGVVANNLTESQFGLASTQFRWNLSGTYQQVVPDYFSTDAEGRGRRTFLSAYFDTTGQMGAAVFLKGYQWPFNAAYVGAGGSSLVDLAVQAELDKGRRVFMDFTRNPTPGDGMAPFDFAGLSDEARRYLERSGALQDTPYQRLAHMNQPSIDIYTEHNVDLHEPLEVAVCSQHNNGGLRGDLWWETNVAHLFAIGEINGSHGIRPGGSALNAGQVGGLRAAQAIAARYREMDASADAVRSIAAKQVAGALANIRKLLAAGDDAPACREVRREIQERMSDAGAFLRSEDKVGAGLNEAKHLRERIARDGIRLTSRREIPRAIQNQHLCLTHIAFLETMQAYLQLGGGSRGSYMAVDPEGSGVAEAKCGKILSFRPDKPELRRQILETQLGPDGEFRVSPVPVRPLPEDDSWFETTWNAWREGRIFGE